MPPDSVPPGQSPPLYIITSTDQAGTIVIVTAVCLVTAVVSILVRAYVMVQSGTLRLRWDDWAVTGALLLAVIQTSIVQREAAIGLGRTTRDLTNPQSQQIQKLQYADQLFYIVSVWVSKFSATLFFYRLSPRANDRKMSRAAITMVGITGFVAVFSVCFVCNLHQPWQYFDSESVTCAAPVSRKFFAPLQTLHLTLIKVRQMGGCVSSRHSDRTRPGLPCYKSSMAATDATIQKTHGWIRLLPTPCNHCAHPRSSALLVNSVPWR